jgi:gamma-glutamylcyclotransferase (GGCT)/AIG2-like uncharacterized protein YtfP
VKALRADRSPAVFIRVHLCLSPPAVPRVWYFAYGSNMQTATFRGRRGIEFHRARPVRVPGWRLVLDKPPLFSIGHAFANVVAEPDAEVLGVAYEVDEEALRAIDLTEGVLIGNYERVVVSATPLGGRARRPLSVHTLTSPRRDPTLSPSTRYMSLLIEGALEHGLPAEYVAFLRTIPATEESAAAKLVRPMLDAAMKLGARSARRQA